MPWWEVRMWLEGLENEFSGQGDEDGGGEARVTHVTDNLDVLGIKPQSM